MTHMLELTHKPAHFKYLQAYSLSLQRMVKTYPSSESKESKLVLQSLLFYRNHTSSSLLPTEIYFTNLWDLDYVGCIDELWALIISIHHEDSDFFRNLE